MNAATPRAMNERLALDRANERLALDGMNERLTMMKD
jgi:hypothetical protein